MVGGLVFEWGLWVVVVICGDFSNVDIFGVIVVGILVLYILVCNVDVVVEMMVVLLLVVVWYLIFVDVDVWFGNIFCDGIIFY